MLRAMCLERYQSLIPWQAAFSLSCSCRHNCPRRDAWVEMGLTRGSLVLMLWPCLRSYSWSIHGTKDVV